MKVAILRVSSQVLRDRFQLPDSTTVHRVRMSFDCDGLDFVIEDPTLPDLPDGAVLPIVNAEFNADGFARYIA